MDRFAVTVSEKVGTVKQFGKATLAMLMAAICAVPMPAAPAAGSSVRRPHRYVTRYRGVPTFADSTSADDGAYDDPIVRPPPVSAPSPYNRTRFALYTTTT